MTARNLRFASALAVFGCCLLVAGCSGLRLAYPHLDSMLAWRADEYFDLNPIQKHELGVRIERLHRWHRRERLPEYAAFLTAATDRARTGLKREDIAWFYDGLKERYRTIVRYAGDDAAEMLATLAPEQLVALQKQWEKANRKFVRENEIGSSVEKRKRARLKKTLDQIQGWTGGLTYEQEQRIEALLESVPLYEHLRHEDRIRRQREFLQLLEVRAKPQEFKPKLKAWLLDWERGRTSAYARLAAEIYDKRVEFYLAVEKLLTPGQRQAVLHRARDYAEDFRALAERPQRVAN